MTLVTVGQIEERNSKRGIYHRVELTQRDGKVVWANLWDAKLVPTFATGVRVDVELETNDQGFTRVVSVAPPSRELPGMPAPAATPGEPDGATVRIYRCTALNDAAALMANRVLSGSTEAAIEATLSAATAFFGWLLNAGDEDDGPDDEAEAF